MLTSQDIYREGAHNGVYMGLFLAVVSVLSFLSDRNSLLGIIAMPMLVCVPALHFSLLRSAYRKYGLDASFSALWMLGITIFVGASMICALATYCYLDFADPDFFYRNCDDGNHERPSGDGRNLQDFQSDGRRRTAAVKHRILHTNDDAHNFQRLAADDCPHPACEAAVQRLQQKKLPITIYPPIIRL